MSAVNPTGLHRFYENALLCEVIDTRDISKGTKKVKSRAEKKLIGCLVFTKVLGTREITRQKQQQHIEGHRNKRVHIQTLQQEALPCCKREESKSIKDFIE